MAKPFVAYRPCPEDYWRGIILFGRNVATYKFALGRALLDLNPQEGQLLSLEGLAVPFSKHLCDHLQLAERQSTSRGSRFLDACRRANAGELNQTELVDQAVRLGFNNVIDAFHVVGRDEVPVRFFSDERKTGGIRITRAFADLASGLQRSNLSLETEARWRLVETAWDLGVAPALLKTVSHDPSTESLFVVDANRRRRSIAGARDALSGYQKGHCFYCFEPVSLRGDDSPDVDHFFAHSLNGTDFGGVIDGVWNLVLACRRCNRGVAGKSNRVPTLNLLERLCTRNEFLIGSNHPLRETLIAQTGESETKRRAFLNARHVEALAALLHMWEPQDALAPLF